MQEVGPGRLALSSGTPLRLYISRPLRRQSLRYHFTVELVLMSSFKGLNAEWYMVTSAHLGWAQVANWDIIHVINNLRTV
jgi:hypothetical protein